ncbi:transposase [Neisseriaceae bacterium B1]
MRELKAKLNRLDTLKAYLQREENRLHAAKITGVPDEVMVSILQIRQAINQSIADLENDVDDHIDKHPDLKRDAALLQSIPYIGRETSMRMVVLYQGKQFKKASQMATFLGLVPRKRESGKYQGKVMLSKRGDSKMRALLYFPAMNACRFNSDVKAQHERLLSRGKVKMQKIGAAMRKLVHICFGVLKHQVVYQSRAVAAI